MLGGGRGRGRWIQQGYPTRKPRSQHTVRCWDNGDNKEVLASPPAGLDGEARRRDGKSRCNSSFTVRTCTFSFNSGGRVLGACAGLYAWEH
jgi:hypothetical protein